MSIKNSSIVNSTWDFACAWYSEEEVFNSIQRHLKHIYEQYDRMPEDVGSLEFARWLTNQYRMAMAKGAEIAIREMNDYRPVE